jgi:hypothetical protein
MPISPEKQDALMEEFIPLNIKNEEVENKKFYDSIPATPENLEKSLFILSRVYRNTSVSDDEFNNEMLNFILESACNFGFRLIDESNGSIIGDKYDEDGKMLLRLAMSFMPLIVETFLYDALCQNNLERILREKIEELKKDSSNNQFKLLLLYLMLIDLDVKGNRKLIEELMEVISLNILKQTVLVKLYTYLMFKAYGNPNLEKFLTEKIEKQHLKINNKIDKGELHRDLEHKKRIVELQAKQDKL